MRFALVCCVASLASGCGLLVDLDPAVDGAVGLDAGAFDGGRADAAPRLDAARADGAIGPGDGGVVFPDDASVTDGGGCGAPETCNAIDDDCDGVIDECAETRGTGFCAADGACVVDACLHPFAECDGDRFTVCETDVDNDAEHCGSCDVACAVTDACVEGSCTADRYVEVSTGDSHTCARTAAGAVHCWGSNAQGETGSNSGRTAEPAPVVIDGPTGAYAISTGDRVSCAAEPRGVFCWGMGAEYRTGLGTEEPRFAVSPTTTVSGSVAALSSGAASSLIADVGSGAVRGWGNNEYGQLGTGSTTPRLATRVTAAATSSVTGASDLSVGDGFACAVVGGQVWCWGANGAGQLGRGTIDGVVPVAAPIVEPVSAADPFVQVDAGQGSTCARTRAGAVLCWGRNDASEVTGMGIDTAAYPLSRTGLGPASDIAVGGRHACAIVSGALYCWGSNEDGQIGIGTTGPAITTPTTVPGLPSVTQVDCGLAHTCAVSTAGGIYCWGDPAAGRLGTGPSPTRTSSAVLVRPPFRPGTP